MFRQLHGSSWWRDEHNEHHAFTNTYLNGVANTDPQMQEVVWAQDRNLFQFVPGGLQRLIVKTQHITFIPILVCG